tara:strand:+ start:2680 stop:3045 length:366 start_codon:yes stop_codon:yes gene_type:complete
MPLTNLTQITGPGIKTTTNLQVNDGQFTGIVTATKFVGDGSDLTSLPAGLGTALSSIVNTPLNNIYYVNDTLHITEHSTVDVPGTASNAYTQYANIQVEDNVNLTVGGDCTFTPDVLSLFP